MPDFRWDNGLWVELPFMAVETATEVTDQVTGQVTDPVDRLLLRVGSTTLASAEIQ
jgi:hypothetical protein